MGRVIVRRYPIVPPETLDPATLDLNGYWLDFAASPWLGVASAGPSLGRNASEGTNAPDVGILNGALFNGSNDVLTIAGPGSDYYTSTSVCGFLLIRPLTAQAALGNVIGDPGILTDASGALDFVYNNEGFTAAVQTTQTPTGLRAVAVAAPVGEWSFCSFRYTFDGVSTGSLAVGRNGAPSVTTTANFASNLDPSFRTLSFGRNYNASKFFHGEIRAAAITDLQITDGQFTAIYNHFATELGL